MFRQRSRIIYFIVIFCIAVSYSNAWAAREEKRKYSMAVKAAKTGRRDFAFMSYRALLKEFPDTKYRDNALFAQGEYYFHLPDFKKAGQFFDLLLKDYPDLEGRLFALAYRLRIAQENKETSKEEETKKEIIAFKRNSFVFEESKDYTYVSPLFTNHKVLFFIDRIEFYVEEKLFAKMDY